MSDRSPLTFEHLKDKLYTDEFAIDRELLDLPVHLQMITDESVALGKKLDDIKIDKKKAEADEKTTRAIVLLYEKNEAKPLSKQPTVDEFAAKVEANPEVREARDKVIQISYMEAQAKADYDKWYELHENMKAKHKSLLAYKDLIISSYVAYKKV